MSWLAAALGASPRAATASEPAQPARAPNGLYDIAARWYEGARLAPATRDPAVPPWWARVSTFPEWDARLQPFLEPYAIGRLQLSLPVVRFDTRALFAPAEHRLGLAAAGIGVLGGSRGGGYVALRPSALSGIAPCFGGSCTPNDGAATARKQARELGNLSSFASGVGLAGLGTTAALYWTLGDMSRHPSEAPLEIYTIGGPSGAGLFMRQPF